MTQGHSEKDRRSRRIPIPKVEVTVEVEGQEVEDLWVGSAIDINADGMALVLPRDLAVGSSLFLSFSPNEDTTFQRVPAAVFRQDHAGGYAAVLFSEWDQNDRLSLLKFLAYQQ